jgi:perosamine synthetase
VDSKMPISLSIPEIRGNEWDYIKDCLDTGWVSSVGSYVDRFEKAIAARTGRRYAVATVNGTAALHMALMVAGVQPDEEVITSSVSFIAPANAIRYVGAWPVFMDADPLYWQMDPEKLESFLSKECAYRDGALHNKQTGRRIGAILPVHVLGHPLDNAIMETARAFGLTVIEDACEALGARYDDGRQAGSTGDIACFSFNGNKLITTGGGGILATDDEAWASRARSLTTQAKSDPLEYIHEEVGYNYRLTNVLAALGVAQLEQLDSYIAAKRHTAATYRDTLSTIPGIAPMVEAPWAFSTFWMFTVLVDAVEYGEDSRELMRRLRRNSIETRPLWQPLHLSPAHAGSQSYHCDVSERLYRDGLSLPCSVGLTEDQQARVIAALDPEVRSSQAGGMA